MPEIVYEYPLDEEAQNWYRFRIMTNRGRVIQFTAQYETTIAGRRFPVLRFDNAHGFAHRDRLDRRGNVVEKSPLTAARTPADALGIGEQDIRTNWRRYRQEFLGESS
jgi:hypothetical protein